MGKEQFKAIYDNEFHTPQWLFDVLNKEFNFQVDLACTEQNKKCLRGLTDSLNQTWHELSDGWMWLNPPYSPLKPWIEKAQKESLKGAKIVVLCPPLISSRYFSRVLPAQIRFILGRISFVRNGKEMPGNSADSCLLIYGPPIKSDIIYIERDNLKNQT